MDDPFGVLPQPAPVEAFLTAQKGFRKAAEAEQVGHRRRVRITAAFRQRERVQAVVVVAALH